MIDRLQRAISATTSARYLRLSVEIGLIVEDGGFPTEWMPAGSGAADLEHGTTDICWTHGYRPYFSHFLGSERVVSHSAAHDWPPASPGAHIEARHSADPLWFIFTVKEALRVGAINAEESAPDRLRVEVDLRSTAQRGSANVPILLISRLFNGSSRRWLRHVEGELTFDLQQRISRSQHFSPPGLLGRISSATAVSVTYPGSPDGLRLSRVGVTSTEARTDHEGGLVEAFRYGFRTMQQLRAEEDERRRRREDDESSG
jgi:hypothetical protein